MSTYRGLPCCSCLKSWLPAFEKELEARGIAVRFTQLNGNYGPSAGTHAGGAFDLVVTKGTYANVVKIARIMGADATWERVQNWDGKGGIRHVHGLLSGCTHLAQAARNQQSDVRAGLNGLANRGPDTGYRPLSGRSWRQGLAWAKEQQKPLRVLSWNVALNLKHPKLSVDYRTSKITAYVKKWDVDAFGLQEAPSSGDGKLLFPKLAKIGLTQRVGSHGRYIIFREDATIHGWKSFEIDKKRFTVAVATIRGRKRAFVNCHPISGEDKKGTRSAWADKAIPIALRFANLHNVPEKEAIWFGDFNGSEFATRARLHRIVRARTYARLKSVLYRSFNGWGRKYSQPGGHFDYVLVHVSKKKFIAKAKTFFTPKASDHNPVFVEIKE